jgi:phosphoglycerate dehydrogenase-like enzyme
MSSVAVTSRSFSTHPVLREELASRYPQITFNDTGKTLEGEALIQFLANHEMAIIGLERIDGVVLSQLTQLKIISRFGVGVDTLDLNALKKFGVKLAATVGANKRSVAELVISLAINMLRDLPQLNTALRAGEWKPKKGRQLSHKTIGIVGLGSIGKDLARLLKAFDCKILVYDLFLDLDYCLAHDLTVASLDEVLQQADIVSLHIPLNELTRSLINAERLQLLKPNAILINTARGGLVDESALKDFLSKNKLAAAAFDVFAVEPPPDQELISLPNFFGTPHIAGSTEEAVLAMGFAAIEGLEKAAVPA